MFGLFHISFYALLVATLVLAMVFLIIPIPKREEIHNYAVSLKVLSCAYIILAIYCFFKPNYATQLISVPFLVISMIQAHCLVLSHINMVSPQSVTKKFVTRMVSPLFILCVIYLIIRIFEPHFKITSLEQLCFHLSDNGHYESCWWKEGGIVWEVFFRLGWLIYYLCLSLFYTVYYFKKEKICRKNLKEYTADFPLINLTIIRVSFILVLMVDFTSMLIPLFIDSTVLAVLNFLMLIFYCIIGILYLQYPKIFLNIYQSAPEPAIHTELEDKGAFETWSTWKEKIIASGIYMTSGITIQQICTELCTNRSTLSSLINKEEGCNFNTFINRLRIEKAKTLMKESNLSLLDICLTVGYSDQGNFSRHFKEVTGESPSEWKRKH